MRNQDGFINSFDYIINQLFTFNYISQKDILKVKLLVLDGSTASDDTTEISMEEPKDHFASLTNELIFFDRYVKTVENTLSGEKSFEELKKERNLLYSNWIKQYTDTDMPYNIRPTLLTDNQFSILYTAFKAKQSNGELINPTDIVYSLISQNIDSEIIAQRQVINNYIPATEAKLAMEANALIFQQKDNISVLMINDVLNEMFNIVLSLDRNLWKISIISTEYYFDGYLDGTAAITVDGTPLALGVVGSLNLNEYGFGDNDALGRDTIYIRIADPNTSVIEFSTILNEQFVIVNMPQNRPVVSLIPFDPSHKGIITNGGGFKFSYLDLNNVIQSLIIDDDYTTNNHTGNLEWDADDTFIAYYYEESSVKKLAPVNNLNNLPSGGSDKGDLTIDRYNLLNDRFQSFNNMRENRFNLMGDRVIIESLVDSIVPELITDHEDYLNELRNKKIYYTLYLTENDLL